ncbi:MAG: DUF3048 domain-containing protein, partial [Caldilineaceae bacterium]
MTASFKIFHKTVSDARQGTARLKNRLPLWVALLLLSGALLLTGCGPEAPAATATPTKTPLPAGEPVLATPVPVAQATDTPVPPTPTPDIPPTATSLPDNIAPYTGKEVADSTFLHKRPILLCINNDAVGRSAHYGLNKADLVYEYIVDGFTITRLTGLYQSQTAARV